MLLPCMQTWHQVAPAQLPRSIILQSVDEVGVNQNEHLRLMIMFHKAGS